MMEKEKKRCPVEKQCGGCQLLAYSYEQQLKRKEKRVSSLLSKYGKVEHIIGMDDPYYYRNKVHAAFSHDRKGNAVSGIYEEGSHRVVNVDSCYLENQKADAIIVTIRKMLKSFRLKTYDEDTGYGFLRHVLVRTAHATGQILVVLVTGTPIFPSKNNFVKVLRKEHPEITTIVQNINDKRTSMVLGERNQILYGCGYIEDILCGKRFRISPKSFYQVNSGQTELLYRKAIEYAGLTGRETVIDAYCGIGTISLVVAEHAKNVTGIELNGDAVKDAIVNKKLNHVKNVRFVKGDAGKFMMGMAAAGEQCDVVFMDPPRSGSTVEFMKSVAAMKPEKVVYISCEPDTLARDLEYFTKHGYRMKRAVPVDMFPVTEHVESVVLMSRVDK